MEEVKHEIIQINSPDRRRREIENKKLEDEWNICCSKSSSACIKFSTQMSIATIVLCFSMIMIIINQGNESEIYFSLISFVVGLVFPHPTLNEMI